MAGVQKNVRTNDAMDFVISGGVASPPGFKEMFTECLMQADLPIKVGEIIKPKENLFSVAKGCLLAAEHSMWYNPFWRNIMIDTKKILDHEVDFLLDSLDFYEKIKFIDDIEYSKIREMVEIMEGQMKRQIESSDRKEEEGVSAILSGLTSYKKEIMNREKEALMSKKIAKEKITLLKAKLILLQQEKAVESVFKNLNWNE